MRHAASIRRGIQSALFVSALVLAGAGNVLAEGVQASALKLYAGLPGRGGRLVNPTSAPAQSPSGAAQHVLITTAENAPDLQAGWQASARAAIELDPQSNVAPPQPRHAVVLTETHTEGRVHTVEVHPDDLEASLPLHLGPTHHEGGVAPLRAARRAAGEA